MMYDYYLSFLIQVKSEEACEVVEKNNRMEKGFKNESTKKKTYKRLQYNRKVS